MKSTTKASNPRASVFSSVLAVSLAKREDRRNALLNNLKQVGWEFVKPKFVHAFTPKQRKMPVGFMGRPTCYAALHSHLKAAQLALQTHKKGGLTMVLEDDAKFVPDFNYRFWQFMNNAPDDWDSLMLGYCHSGIRPYTGTEHNPMPPFVGRARFYFGLHCYIIREPMLSAWLEALQHADAPADWVFSSLMCCFKVYIPLPNPLCLQADGKSDITGTNRKLS